MLTFSILTVPRGGQCTCSHLPSTKTLIVHYACNPPRALHMALLTPKDLRTPPYCLLGFGEAVKISYTCMFHSDDGCYDAFASRGGIEVLGPSRRFRFSIEDQSHMGTLQTLVNYFLRMFDGMPLQGAKDIAATVTNWTLHSRLRFLCGSRVQSATAYWSLIGRNVRTAYMRPSHFVAVEMDTNGAAADVYYGRVLRMMEFDLTTQELGGEREVWKRGYKLVVMDWVQHLLRGGQRQIYMTGRDNSVFSGTTMEEASITKGPITVVEHVLPPPQSRNASISRASGSYGARRSYFFVDCVYMDGLHSQTAMSTERMKRGLRGFSEEIARLERETM